MIGLIDSWLKKRSSKGGREWGYYNVPSRIIIEKMLERDENNDIPDYKFFCFNGKAKYLYVMIDYVDAHSRIGVFCTIGNNNWIAAKVNLDHHNILGNSSLLGPGVMTSGLVKIGSNSLIGAGTSIIPSVTIGDNCLVPAGSVIVNDIPDGTRLKIKA